MAVTALESPADRLAVAETVARLAAAQDARDWDGLRALLAAHVRFDLSRHLGLPAAESSAEDFVARARSVASGFTATHHLTSNLVVDLHPGTGEATCHAHVLAYHHLADAPDPDDAICVMRGTWTLDLRKTGTRWLVEQFTVVRTAPLEGNADLYTRTATGGRRD